MTCRVGEATSRPSLLISIFWHSPPIAKSRCNYLSTSLPHRGGFPQAFSINGQVLLEILFCPLAVYLISHIMFKRASPGNRTSKGEDATSEPLLDEENRLLNAWSTQDTEPATDYPRYRKYLSTAAKYCLVAVMGLMIATLAFPEVVIRLTQMMSFQPLSIPSKWCK